MYNQTDENLAKEELLEEFDKLKRTPEPLKDSYLEFIKNKQFSLKKRWEVFCEAPKSFKEHDGWMHHFDIEKKVGEMSWFDGPFYYDRRMDIKTESIIERLYDHLDDEEPTRWTEELIQELQEEILEKNLGSFTLDW